MQTKVFPITLSLSIKQIYFIIISLVLFNFLFLKGMSIHNGVILESKHPLSEFFLQQFNLALENVTAAWYSSMLLLSVGLAAGLCFLVDRQKLAQPKERFLSYGWVVLFFMFTLLSFDEIGSVHEMINEINVLEVGEEKDAVSLTVLAILVGIVGLFMLAFFWIKFRRSFWALLFAIGGLLLFLSNPVQEAYEMHLMHTTDTTWRRPNIFAVIEEGSEIFGSLSFLISFLIYAGVTVNKSMKLFLKKGIYLNASVSARQLFYFLGTGILVLGVFMMVIYVIKEYFGVSDRGIPGNWFPSTIAFIGFLLNLYFFLDSTVIHRAPKSLFLFTSMLCLISSAYFGSNIYAHPLLDEAGALRSVQGIKLLSNIILGLWIIYLIQTKKILFGIGLFFAFSIATFFAGKTDISYLVGYVSFSTILIISVFINSQGSSNNANKNDFISRTQA